MTRIWSPLRRLEVSLWIGRIRKRLCKHVLRVFIDAADLFTEYESDIHGQPADDAIHFELANEMLKALYSDDMESTSIAFESRRVIADRGTEDDRKVFCQLLGKLYLPEKVDEDKLKTVKLLMHNLRSVRPPHISCG